MRCRGVRGGGGQGRRVPSEPRPRLGPKAAPALPWLLSAAKYGESEISEEAFAALGAMGQTAWATRPELRSLARLGDRVRADLAREALREMSRPRE